MKKLVLLFTALLVMGCGEKSSSEGSDSVGESTGPSSDAAKQVPTESPGKGVEEIEVPGEFLEIDWGSGGSSNPIPPSLSDADVERLLKEAVDYDSLEERDAILYQGNTPYSGWAKKMHDSGQVAELAELKKGKVDSLMRAWHENGQKRAEGTFKDGKQDGPFTAWHENGQKMFEGTYKDGNQVGLSTGWHENGQKAEETTFKDTYPHGLWIRWHKNGQKQSETIWENSQKISVKYWNSKGEEVETEEEARK